MNGRKSVLVALFLVVIVNVGGAEPVPWWSPAPDMNEPKAVDAELSPGVAANWDIADAWRQVSANRERICINGLWRFWPDENNGGIPAVGTGWCWLKVPGGWPASHRWGHNPYSMMPIMSKRWDYHLKVDPDRGDWRAQNDKVGQWIPFDNVRKGWYQRTVEIPSAWKGRNIRLIAESVEQSAKVFIDGVSAGKIEWPDGEVDITEFVRLGKKKITVSILVGGKGGLRGLAGDVYIESRGGKTHIDVPYIVTSVKNKTLTVRAGLISDVNEEGLRFSAKVTKDGKVVKSFKSIPVELKGDELVGSWGWAEPELWSLESPVLHDITVRLENKAGELIDEALPVRFGFREFIIEGRDILLNGVPIHIKPQFWQNGAHMGTSDSATIEMAIPRYKAFGYNMFSQTIYGYFPGGVYYNKAMLEACDRKGMLVQFQLPKPGNMMEKVDGKYVVRYEGLDEWTRASSIRMRRFRQHPSIIFWATNQNIFATAQMFNPREWAAEDLTRLRYGAGIDNMKKIFDHTQKTIDEIDGSRPVYFLGDGQMNKDVISTYSYTNFHPVQEISQYPSLWAEKGKKALVLAEWGAPLWIDFNLWRTNHPIGAIPKLSIDPMYIEADAIFNGEQAYQVSPVMEELYRRHEAMVAEGPYNLVQMHGLVDENRTVKHFMETQAEFVRRVVPVWRSYNMSGIHVFLQDLFWNIAKPEKDYYTKKTDWAGLQSPGISPDNGIWPLHWGPMLWPERDAYFELNPVGKVIEETHKPVLCFVGGDADSDGAVASVAHQYVPGQLVKRQLILINDTERKVSRTAIWSVQDGGKVLASGKELLSAMPGGQGRKTIAFKVADRDAKLKLRVRFELSDGAVDVDIVKDIEVIAPVANPDSGGLGLYDPAGSTALTLKRLGIGFVRVTGDRLPENIKAVIIGQKALTVDSELSWLAEPADGVNILILEQSPEVLSRRFGFRYADRAHRNVYIRCGGMDLLGNLTNENLRDWTGSATLVEPFPDMTAKYLMATPTVDWLGFKNPRCYRWGNSGSVATRSIFKPRTGNFVPLIDGGFDLNDAALLAYNDEKGRIVFCQMDVTARTAIDPVADNLLRGLVGDILAPYEYAGRRCVVLDEATKEFLAGLDIVAKVAGNKQQWGGSVLVLDGDRWPGEEKAGEISEWINDGGVVIALGADGGQLSGLSKSKIVTEKSQRISDPLGSGIPKDWWGISAAFFVYSTAYGKPAHSSIA